ncbi:unnamed protein product, partial [Clonostachys byssicola]
PIDPETWNIVLGPRAATLNERFDHTIAITFGYEPLADMFSTAFPPNRLISASPSVVKLASMLPAAEHLDLDLVCFTERNSYSGNDTFGVWAPKDKLVSHGIEVNSRFGHWQGIGIDRGRDHRGAIWTKRH